MSSSPLGCDFVTSVSDEGLNRNSETAKELDTG